MAFTPICRHFGVDPQALRARLLSGARDHPAGGQAAEAA
jgi:hypothetical protein